jgi:chromosome segregation ATPase
LKIKNTKLKEAEAEVQALRTELLMLNSKLSTMREEKEQCKQELQKALNSQRQGKGGEPTEESTTHNSTKTTRDAKTIRPSQVLSGLDAKGHTCGPHDGNSTRYSSCRINNGNYSS